MKAVQKGATETVERETRSTQVSRGNTLRAVEIAQHPPSKDKGTRLEHQNVGQRSLLSDEETKNNVTDLSQTYNNAGIKKKLVSHGRSGSDARAENLQLAFKYNCTNLEIEKLWLTLMQKEVTVMPMISAIVVLEKRTESLKIEHKRLLQTNEDIHQRSWLLRKIQSVAKKALEGRVHNEFFGIAEKVGDAIYKRCEKGVLEQAHYEKHIHKD